MFTFSDKDLSVEPPEVASVVEGNKTNLKIYLFLCGTSLKKISFPNCPSSYVFFLSLTQRICYSREYII